MLRSVFLCVVMIGAALVPQAAGQTLLDQAGPVQLKIASAGVGGLARLGDWAGFQIEFTDQNDAQREVIIQIEGRDSDGDLPMYQRTVTTNPGVKQRTWLYLWIPGTRDVDDPFTVAAYEAIAVDTETAERTGVRYRRGRLLGRSVEVPQRQLLHPEVAGMLVLGKRVGGLIGYSQRAQNSDSFLPRGHEVTEIAFDLRPRDLPDRWLGLSEFEVIVWTSANPAELSTTRAKALTEWVRRGGHLVVCLPPTGQIWQDTTRNELAPLLPDVEIKRLGEGESTIDRLLTHDGTKVLPKTLVVQRLQARATAGRDQAIPILIDREGHVVVSRRLVDLGAVTLIGMDVSNRNLADRGLPAMDAFWHRVLGRRGRLPDRTSQGAVGLTAREVTYFDAEIGGVISTSGSAGAALLLGFILFAIYWAVAGPVGYAVLKHFGLKRFAWMGFVVSIAFFTAVGWGSVSVLRPKKASINQVSFLDAVYGTRFHRARTFASIFVPGYGDAAVRVGDPMAESTTPFLNAATPWNDGFSSLLPSASFPDSRAYPVSARHPDRISFPSRATEKRFRFEWAGEARWAMPQPVTGSGGEGELHLNSQNKPVGTLVHHLPGGLRDTIVVVVRGQRNIGSQTGLPVVSNYSVYRFPAARDVWAPGVPLNLETFTSNIDETGRSTGTYFDDLISYGRPLDGVFDQGKTVSRNVNDRLIASAFLSQLKPPQQSDREIAKAGLRRSIHGLDLGRWLTEPCIMILGVVESNAEQDQTPAVPISLYSGGKWRPVASSGKTVVRWVYPLPAKPPIWPRSGFDDSPADGS